MSPTLGLEQSQTGGIPEQLASQALCVCVSRENDFQERGKIHTQDPHKNFGPQKNMRKTHFQAYLFFLKKFPEITFILRKRFI